MSKRFIMETVYDQILQSPRIFVFIELERVYLRSKIIVEHSKIIPEIDYIEITSSETFNKDAATLRATTGSKSKSL